jgi:hypothetical protein
MVASSVLRSWSSVVSVGELGVATVHCAPFRGSRARVGSKFVAVRKDYLGDDPFRERGQRVMPYSLQLEGRDSRAAWATKVVINPHVSNCGATRGSNLTGGRNVNVAIEYLFRI